MTDARLEPLLCDIHGPFVPFCGKRCPQCDEEYRLKREYEEAQKQTQERLDSARIPPRFCGKTLQSFEGKTPAQEAVLGVVQDYVHRFPEHFAAGRCLTFLGGVGVGKSHLGCAVA